MFCDVNVAPPQDSKCQSLSHIVLFYYLRAFKMQYIYTPYHGSNLIWGTVSCWKDELISSNHMRNPVSSVVYYVSSYLQISWETQCQVWSTVWAHIFKSHEKPSVKCGLLCELISSNHMRNPVSSVIYYMSSSLQISWETQCQVWSTIWAHVFKSHEKPSVKCGLLYELISSNHMRNPVSSVVYYMSSYLQISWETQCQVWSTIWAHIFKSHEKPSVKCGLLYELISSNLMRNPVSSVVYYMSSYLQISRETQCQVWSTIWAHIFKSHEKPSVKCGLLCELISSNHMRNPVSSVVYYMSSYLQITWETQCQVWSTIWAHIFKSHEKPSVKCGLLYELISSNHMRNPVWSTIWAHSQDLIWYAISSYYCNKRTIWSCIAHLSPSDMLN